MRIIFVIDYIAASQLSFSEIFFLICVFNVCEFYFMTSFQNSTFKLEELFVSYVNILYGSYVFLI